MTRNFGKIVTLRRFSPSINSQSMTYFTDQISNNKYRHFDKHKNTQKKYYFNSEFMYKIKINSHK